MGANGEFHKHFTVEIRIRAQRPFIAVANLTQLAFDHSRDDLFIETAVDLSLFFDDADIRGSDTAARQCARTLVSAGAAALAERSHAADFVRDIPTDGRSTELIQGAAATDTERAPARLGVGETPAACNRMAFLEAR